MQKLTIDQGNTRIKVALFNHDTIIKRIVDPTIQSLEQLIKTSDRLILSTVKRDSRLESLLRKNDIKLNRKTSLPIRINYDTTSSLGQDRLAISVGANALFPKNNVLCIDMGTCITFDFVSADNEFLGGGISPGMRMRYKALNQHTDLLPLLNVKKSMPKLIGQSTYQSIHSGVVNGLIAEIDGIIGRYESIFPSLKVLITGGDLRFFDKALKNTIFACPDLLMIGLNKILDYNETSS